MISTNIVDIVILFIFLFSIIGGFARGFISEVISLLTLIAAFVVAGLFAEPVAAFFTHSSPVNHAVNSSASAGMDATQAVSYAAIAVSFILLFILTSIVGAVIKYIINIVFRAGVLGLANRLLGMFFGFARGFLLNVLLIFIVQLTPASARAEWQASHYVPLFAPYVSYLSSKVSPALAGLKDKYGAALGDAASSIENATQNIKK